MKAKIKRTFRLLKALATDPRIPRPVRWLIGVSLAVKAVPFPDFGIDEIGLLVALVLLRTVYRERFNEIREEIRQEEELSRHDEDNGDVTEDQAVPGLTVDPDCASDTAEEPKKSSPVVGRPGAGVSPETAVEHS